MSALGEEFRAAREARGLSLSDVAEQIHIRSLYLQAIETEDWAAIGPPVYIRGFIRTYARFLGLDAEDAVARFAASGTSGAAALGSASARQTAPRSAPVASGRPSVWLWLSGAVALGLIGYVLYTYYLLQTGDKIPQSRSGPSVRSTVAPPTGPTSLAAAAGASEAPTQPTAAPVEPSAASKKRKVPPSGPTLTVRVTDASWVRVVVDGAVAMEGVYPAGTLKSFHGKQAMVRIGNAGGVALAVNGRNLGKLGASGDVVERTLSLARE